MRKTLHLPGLLIALLAFVNGYSQDYSNKGKDFWVIYTGHIDGTSSRMALYITSDQNATGTVTVAGNVINFTVAAYQVTTVRLTNTSTPANAVAYNGQAVGIGVDKGIHIVSDYPVVVYSHILNSARSGSTLVLPTNVLGREYYVSTYKSITGNGSAVRRSEFAIVASQDATTVEINAVSPDANNTYPANVPFQVTLNKGDVFQYQSFNDSDLTGTYIKSIATGNSPCKPIAVFAGSTWTAMGCSGAGSGDNLYQQLFPFVSWGLEYITAPFIARSYDVFRVLVKDPSTVVQVNGITLNPATLISNTYYDFTTAGDNTPRHITADKPICVVQYLITQNCDGVNSDPEMIILNSIEQTLKDITVLSARNDLTPPLTNISQHYLNIIIKTSALSSLKIDGASYSSTPVAIANTPYSYLQENVTSSTQTNPAHRITSDSGFVAIAYGYGNVESYGYNAGTNVKDLYQFIGIRNQYATVNFPAACRNSPFYFSITFPYQPTQITWDFGGLFPNVTLNNPVYDSTWMVNAKQLYMYRLPVPYTVFTTGTYPIKLYADNPTPDGCSGRQEVDYDLLVVDRPVADFTFANNGCITDTVFFTDASNLNGRGAVNWHWDFDDGNTDNIQDTKHKYFAPGSYTVRHSVVTDIGCFADTAKVVNLEAVPAAKFGVTLPSCAGKVITFSDSSSVSGASTLVKWIWNFGDGSPLVIATTNAPQTHTFPNAGNYTVTLQVQANYGCLSQVFPKPVVISPIPHAGFISPEVCLTDPVAPFTDTSHVATGNIATWNWNFGDSNATPGNPNTSSLQNPGHRYTAVGSYTATLIVTSDGGCTDTVSQAFTVNGSVPLAGFTVPNAAALCSNQPVAITDASTVDFGSMVKVEIYWDFANAPFTKFTDDIPVPGKTYTHLYPEFGSPSAKTYTIRYVAYSGINCVNTIDKSITVLATPSLQFDPVTPVCANDPAFQLTQVQLLNGLPGTGFFTGAGVSAGGWFDPALMGPGVDTIRYTYTGTNSCVNYRQQPVTVYPVPTADAGPDLYMLEGGQATLLGAGSGNTVSYLWSPAASLNKNTVAQPVATPAADTYYTLTVTSVDGCKTNDQAWVKVLKMPLIPNIFSPNGDGIHDTWEITYLSTYPHCTVNIYNRYGQLIFRSAGYDTPWDGTISGKPVPVGTYYYVIEPGSGRPGIAGYVDVLR